MKRKQGVGSKKVLAGGCFNLIHPGHIFFLKKAASFGDELVVVVAHDENNEKPYARPQEKRKNMVEELGIADKVLIGNPEDKLKIIKKEDPDLIVLGYDQHLGFLDQLEGIEIN